MTLKEMQERLNALASEMRALNDKGDERTSDEESRFDQVIAEFNDLGEQFTEAKSKDEQRKAALNNAGQYRQSAGRIAGTLPTPGAEQREQDGKKIDRRSLGQRFAESEQIVQYRRSGAPKGTQSQPFEVGSFYARHQVEHTENTSPDELRALIQTGNLPNDYIAPQRIAGFFRGDDLQGSLRDVLINGTTTSDAILFFRETAFTNNAAAVAQATATTGTSGLKQESAITFEQATAPVVTIAHWVPITRQTLEDAAQLRTYVEQRLIDGLRLVESDSLLNGTGTPDMDGLLETTGIQFLDNTATTGYWATNPVSDAGSPNENFNRILRAKTLVRTVGRATPNFVVLNPADLEVFLSATNANQNYYGTGPFSGNGVPSLWGLRVVEDENIAAGEALVGDGRMAAVWDRMQAQIITGYIDDQLVRNMMTLLAEERLALTVFRPTAFVHLELAA